MTLTLSLNAQENTNTPPKLRFDLKNLSEGQYNLVGRFTLKRQVLGTKAGPTYRDSLQFHSFRGAPLKFSTLTNSELENTLIKKLANGHSLPVIAFAEITETTTGHDGINSSKRLVTNIKTCKPITAERLHSVATVTGIEEAEFQKFKATLAPDYEKDGIALNFGKIAVIPNPTPRGSGLSIHGIHLFNTTDNPVTVTLTKITLTQGNTTQEVITSKRSNAPKTWQIPANDWSDGHYEVNQTPRTLWLFNHTKPIQIDQDITVTLNLKINDTPITLTKIINLP